jgi:hypothetical protein
MFNGFIYRISSNLTERVYIGSTTQSVEERLQKHRADYNRYLKGTYHYVTSFELIKLTHYEINIIQTVEVNSKKELRELEAIAIRGEANVVNKFIPNRTKAQYRQEYKEEIKIYQSQYYQDNRERIAQYRQDNREQITEQFNCKFCSGRYTKTNKSIHYKTNKHIKEVNALKKMLKANPAFLNL